MRISLRRARPRNIWHHGLLEGLSKIFYSDFNHDYHEKYYRSWEHLKMLIVEVLKIQVAAIKCHQFFHLGVSRGFSIKFRIICGVTFLVNLED
jgi:hypothetical protein